MNELALFAGAGGGILGGKLLGWRTVCAVEYEPYARDVLVARQNDGCLDPFPIWDDVRTFDGHPWRGVIDVVSGGFPCQDISAAGRGAGITGERSGLWAHMARIVGEVRPRYVFVENSPLLVSRGLEVVLGDLAALGFDAEWGVIGAHHAGAPHKRDRIWIVADAGIGRFGESGEREAQQSGRAKTERAGEAVADAASQRPGSTRNRERDATPNRTRETDRTRSSSEILADAGGAGFEGGEQPGALRDERHWSEAHGPVGECGGTPGSLVSDAMREKREGWAEGYCGRHREPRHAAETGIFGTGNNTIQWWLAEPDVGRVAHGVADGVDVHGLAPGDEVGRVAVGVRDRAGRLKAIGNGQVPAVAALAWWVLSDEDGKE